MKLHHWMLGIFLTMALVGCGTLADRQPLREASASLSAQAKQEALYPVTVGSFWRYETVQRNGQEPERPGAEQRIAITRELDGNQGSKVLLERWYGAFQPPTTLVETTPQGVTLSRYSKPEEGSITILQYPLVKGKSWTGRVWPRKAAETITYVGTESIEVPAGRFVASRLEHAIRYASGHTDTLCYWYAPGVGMVQASETMSLDQGGVLVPHSVKAMLVEFGKTRGS